MNFCYKNKDNQNLSMSHKLMYDTNKKQVRLIDPDAFHKESPGEFPPIWHGLFIDTLYNTSQWEKYDHRLWDQP